MDITTSEIKSNTTIYESINNQYRNAGVRTVEEELEKALFTAKFISECNYGFLIKINWMRASRTDKGVSAIMNVVSCKLHKYPNRTEEDMKNNTNELLPLDIRIFRIIEMSDNFNAKDNNNHREYHYILPSFMLEPRERQTEPKAISNDNNTKEEISQDNYQANYDFKITPEFKDKIIQICNAFKGSKKFHNYTKKIDFSEAQSVRHIYDLSIGDIGSFDSFEYIKFKIVGQSFLYNQIRKMIGMIIELCRDCKGLEYMNQSFLSEKMEVPKAPAEGLYLRKIDYSRYNDRKLLKKNSLCLTEEDDKSMDDFCDVIIKDIEQREIKDKAFSKWQWRFDYFKDHIY